MNLPRHLTDTDRADNGFFNRILEATHQALNPYPNPGQPAGDTLLLPFRAVLGDAHSVEGSDSSIADTDGITVGYEWRELRPMWNSVLGHITWGYGQRSWVSCGSQDRALAYEMNGLPATAGSVVDLIPMLSDSGGMMFVFASPAASGIDVWVDCHGGGTIEIDAGDWRGMNVPVYVVRYAGTAEDANADAWEGPRELDADWIPQQAGMCGAGSAADAAIWQYPRYTSPSFALEVWCRAADGHIDLVVDAPPEEFPMQVRVCAGHPSPTVKTGPDLILEVSP